MIEKNYSPDKKQAYIWFAEYDDKTLITEIKEDLTENIFDSIDKEKVSIFGLLGEGRKLYYDTSTGIFYIDNGKIDFYLIDEETGTEYNLTKSSKDIITYKLGYSDFDPAGNRIANKIGAYYFGYKTKIEESGVNFYTQFIYAFPADRPEERALLFKIVADKNIRGKIRISGNTAPIEIEEGKTTEGSFKF